jgi:hypothetical protein
LAEPLSWVDELGDLSSEDIERVMSSNMFGLMGLDARAAV